MRVKSQKSVLERLPSEPYVYILFTNSTEHIKHFTKDLNTIAQTRLKQFRKIHDMFALER